MMSPSEERAAQSAASIQTYYATADFRVRRYQLRPGERLAGHAVAASHWIAMQSGLGYRLEKNATVPLQPLEPGKRLTANEGQSFHVECIDNANGQPVDLLEILWEPVQGPERQPIGEITEVRPWGSFTVLADEPHFKLKQLMVAPGNRLSLQRHRQREEHWFVTAGQPEITVNDSVTRHRPGDYIQIPLQAWHRLANPAANNIAADSVEPVKPVEIIELQLGTYFGEDDIERRDDDYGRA